MYANAQNNACEIKQTTAAVPGSGLHQAMCASPAAPAPKNTMAGGLGQLADIIHRAKEIAAMVEHSADKFGGIAAPICSDSSDKCGQEPNGAVEYLHYLLPSLSRALSRIEDAGYRLHRAHD